MRKVRTFKDSLERLRKRASEVIIDQEGGLVATYFDKMYYQSALEALSRAEEEKNANKLEVAWSCLVEAAENIGRLSALSQIANRTSPTEGVNRLLRKNGAKGGTAKGENSARLRDRAAKALIAAAKVERWPSREQFDLRYHEIVKGVPGFSDTEHQRRALLKREDIRAILPPKRARKR